MYIPCSAAREIEESKQVVDGRKRENTAHAMCQLCGMMMALVSAYVPNEDWTHFRNQSCMREGEQTGSEDNLYRKVQSS